MNLRCYDSLVNNNLWRTNFGHKLPDLAILKSEIQDSKSDFGPEKGWEVLNQPKYTHISDL